MKLSAMALDCEDGMFIGFQRVDDYRKPHWPYQMVPQQIRLDFAVEDLGEAEASCWSLAQASPSTIWEGISG